MIDVTIDEGIALVTMNKPERRNALDLAGLDLLAQIWERCEQDDDVRVVVLTGAGDEAFSAGADLKGFAPPGVQPAPTHDAFFPEQVLSKPLVAAVNGWCVAGGCELLLACDVRVAAEHARFSLPEPQLGLFPAGGSAVRAPRRLGWAAAMYMLLTGEQVDAATAQRFGLVTHVVPGAEVVPLAMQIARRIADNSADAVRAIKRSALESDGLPLHEAFARQAAYSMQVHEGPDAREGFAAFREKRAPNFR